MIQFVYKIIVKILIITTNFFMNINQEIPSFKTFRNPYNYNSFFKDEEEDLPTQEVELVHLDKQHLLRVQSLFKKAMQFFESPLLKEKEAYWHNICEPSANNNNPPDYVLINRLLRNSRGFCIGEKHIESAARNFLLKNMYYLAQKNVKIIGVEGINAAQQPILDAYIFDDPSTWSNETAKKIDELLEKSRLFKRPKEEKYRFDNVLEAARKYKIRVIGLDYDFTKFFDTWQRQDGPQFDSEVRAAMMNYTAIIAMEKALKTLKKGEKFVCFMGKNHVLRRDTHSKILGVANLLQCPSMIFEGDISDGKQYKIRSVVYGATGKFLDPVTATVIYHF